MKPVCSAPGSIFFRTPLLPYLWRIGCRCRQIAVKGIYKCRVIYAEALLQVAFIPYTPRPIRSLKLVVDDAIDYAWKYEDRSALNHLFFGKPTATTS